MESRSSRGKSARMRWQYSHLNETPYLYPSKELRSKYKGSSGKKTNAIVDHMERHEVFNNREYKGYYRLSNDIMDDLYEDEVFDWGDVINEYQPVMTSKGLQLIRKEGIQMTIVGEAVVVWTATSLSVITMKVAEK